MTKIKNIKRLINSFNKKKPADEDIKIFSSAFIELMAESGVPTSTRREFFLYTQKPSPDIKRIVEFAEDTMTLIL